MANNFASATDKSVADRRTRAPSAAQRYSQHAPVAKSNAATRNPMEKLAQPRASMLSDDVA